MSDLKLCDRLWGLKGSVGLAASLTALPSLLWCAFDSALQFGSLHKPKEHMYFWDYIQRSRLKRDFRFLEVGFCWEVISSWHHVKVLFVKTKKNFNRVQTRLNRNPFLDNYERKKPSPGSSDAHRCKFITYQELYWEQLYFLPILLSWSE